MGWVMPYFPRHIIKLEGVIMFKKRCLAIVIGLLLAVSIITVPFGIRWYRAYAVCRDKLSDGWKYQRTKFFPENYYGNDRQAISLVFYSKTEGVECYVRHNGSEWDAIMLGWSLYP
jgi:hypothetical protein